MDGTGVREISPWLEYGGFGLAAFVVVTLMSLGTWFVKHITPKAIDAFNENVKLQKAMSETLTALAERLAYHDSNAQLLAGSIRTDIRDLRIALIEKLDEHGRKIDRIMEPRR